MCLCFCLPTYAHAAPNFDHKNSDWFSFLTHEKGIPVEKRFIDKAQVLEHDPSDKDTAFRYARNERVHFGLLFQRFDKPCYDDIIQSQFKEMKVKRRDDILDAYKI